MECFLENASMKVFDDILKVIKENLGDTSIDIPINSGRLYIDWKTPEIPEDIKEKIDELFKKWIYEIRRIQEKYNLTDEQLKKYLWEIWNSDS